MFTIAAELAQQGRDFIDVLEVLVLPIVLAVIPFLLKRASDATKASTEAQAAAGTVKNAAETVHATGQAQVIMFEQVTKALMEIGGLHTDVKHIKEDFREHVDNDNEFMETTRDFMINTQGSLKEITQAVKDR